MLNFLPKMAAWMLLNHGCFNAEVTLDHTNSYYLKQFDETFLKWKESLRLMFTLALAKVMLNLFPSVYIYTGSLYYEQYARKCEFWNFDKNKSK